LCERYLMSVDWSEQKVVVVGAARQGLALAQYLVRHGARVVLNDRLSEEQLLSARQALADLEVEWVLGGHPLSLLDDADMICVSGGVPLNLPLIVEAQSRGIRLSNDSQIFMETAPCTVVGITGSAGKTTTTTLVGRMAQYATTQGQLECQYRRAWMGGNIGSPLITDVDKMQSDDLVVMEVSSFQLELMSLSPQVAAVLNLTPNHLDRHGTMEAYRQAKARILQFQQPDDRAVLGRDDPGAWSLAGIVKGQTLSFGFSPLAENQPGAFFWKDVIYLRPPANAHNSGGDLQPEPLLTDVRLLSRQDVALRGEHNLLNVMAACTIAAAAGLPLQAMKAGVENFGGVAHRLEFVRSWGGADWYNDSIATAPERAMAAIRSFDEPLVLLAGGRDKNLPWDDFARLSKRCVDQLIVFGEAAELISEAAREAGFDPSKIVHCTGLHEAVRAAAQIVKPGYVVLLSPGGTSFDEFIDFEERGKCFAQWVKELP
jgi:UDP-N-acetylmuramoylalanine--D-glutamate ligase